MYICTFPKRLLVRIFDFLSVYHLTRMLELSPEIKQYILKKISENELIKPKHLKICLSKLGKDFEVVPALLSSVHLTVDIVGLGRTRAINLQRMSPALRTVEIEFRAVAAFLMRTSGQMCGETLSSVNELKIMYGRADTVESAID